MKHELGIQSVSLLSGVSAHTLRAWERRYEAIVPERTSTGRRVYASEDVHRLKLMVTLLERGHAISGIARLSRKELETLILQTPAMAPSESTAATERPAQDEALAESTDAVCLSILKAIKILDLDAIDREFSRASLNFSAPIIAMKIFSPLMNEIGRQVDEGSLGIAEEHMLSALLRDQLGRMLHMARQGGVTKDQSILIAAPEGDYHEFGILLAAVLCASRGFRIHYLGASLPAEEILRIARSTSPLAVIVGSTGLLKTPGNARNALQKFYKKMADRLPKSVEFWIGGPVAFRPSASRRKILHLASLTDLSRQLDEISTPPR